MKLLLENSRLTINRSVEAITITMLITMVIVVAAQVFWRYVLSSSLGWSEELSRFLFIWIIFLGTEIALRKKAHIALDSLEQMLKGISKLLLSILIDIIIIIFAIIVFISGIELTQSTINQPSAALSLPMSWVYVVIPVSMGLIIMNTLYSIIKKVTSKQVSTG